jgi:hypothetical protein
MATATPKYLDGEGFRGETMVLESIERNIDPYAIAKSMKSLEKQFCRIMREGSIDDDSRKLLRQTADSLNRNFELLMENSSAAVQYFAFRPNTLFGVGRAHNELYKPLGEYIMRFSYDSLTLGGLGLIMAAGTLQPSVQWIEQTEENHTTAISILGEMKKLVNSAVYARLGEQR